MSRTETGRPSGIIRAIAFRETKGEPMREIDECRVVVSRGIDRENRPPGRRGVTLLSTEAWVEVCKDLGVGLPWYTRRANVLVEGLALPALIGKPVVIGGARVWIHGESKPCQLMEDRHDGLRAALRHAGRGGVFGQVLVAGVLRVGDVVTVDPSH